MVEEGMLRFMTCAVSLTPSVCCVGGIEMVKIGGKKKKKRIREEEGDVI